MKENSTVVRQRQPDEIDDPLTTILRSGTGFFRRRRKPFSPR